MGVVRNISSPQRVASMSNLCKGRCQRAGDMGNVECCSGFGKRHLFSGNAAWDEWEWKRFQIS